MAPMTRPLMVRGAEAANMCSPVLGSYYYTTMSNALRSKAEGGVRAIRTYQSESRYYQYARSVVSDAAGEQLEVEFIDAIGLIRFSSSDLQH